MKNLPKTLFATLRDAGTSDEFFDTRSDKNDLVTMNETVVVGEYVLKRRLKIRGVAQEIEETN